MTDNSFVLSGVVCKQPQFSQSPAGIPHCSFVLEHRSQQVEAGLPRNAYVRIQVVASGLEFKAQTQDLEIGHPLTVSGFLNRVQGKNGLSQLVLHARQIERQILGDLSHGTLLQTS